MKAIITVGISASGKSTYAAEMVEQGYTEINRDWIRFNIVKPGQDWRNYKVNRSNEDAVSLIHGQAIMDSWGRGENIIVSDTNLNCKARTKLIKHLEDLGYTVELKTFTVSLQTAWKRDTYRLNGVGRDVIYNQWEKWNEFIERPTYKPNEKLPKAVIVDIDGTVADMKNYRGPFAWDKVDLDDPRKFVIQMVNGYLSMGYHIIFVSGRSDECRDLTEEWLDQYVGEGWWHELHMRKEGDFRKDDAVKEEIFWTQLADRYNIVGVIDDRPQVLRLWYDLKIPNVICVGNPYKEF